MTTHDRRNGVTWIGLLGAALAMMLVGAACGSSGRQGSAASGDAGQPQYLTVSLKEFSISPSTIQAAAGRPLQISVTNEGSAPHVLAIAAGGRTFQTAQIETGASASMAIPALQVGSYQAWCPIPGHKEAGMTATLAVGPAGQAAGSGGSMPGMSDGGGMSNMSAAEMAKMHQDGLSQFPAKTEGTGNEPLRPQMQDGWKVFRLVAWPIRWESSPGHFEQAFAFNRQIPGPQIRVHQGDRVRIVVQNELTQPTAAHFHGLTVPNAMDGVPGITQDPIMPGESFTYSFRILDQPGTYMYHSHFNSAEQMGLGLYGAFIVEPKSPSWDREYTMFLGEGALGYTINGKGFPATEPLTATLGEKVLIRMIDVGEMTHTMHLHGYHFPVIAHDGYSLNATEDVDTVVISPGQTIDGLVTANHLGVWAFHCHVLNHAEGPQGMFGMVTAFIVTK